jgi:hypothetical protein
LYVHEPLAFQHKWRRRPAVGGIGGLAGLLRLTGAVPSTFPITLFQPGLNSGNVRRSGMRPGRHGSGYVALFGRAYRSRFCRRFTSTGIAAKARSGAAWSPAEKGASQATAAVVPRVGFQPECPTPNTWQNTARRQGRSH